MFREVTFRFDDAQFSRLMDYLEGNDKKQKIIDDLVARGKSSREGLTDAVDKASGKL
jgi:polyhydroxyalkanoate synthesis regulator phasin